MAFDNRETAMKRLQMTEFALIEANLFLDTHPKSAEALEYFKCVTVEHETALKYYEENFGPITAKSANAKTEWDWIDSPWPWELEV